MHKLVSLILVFSKTLVFSFLLAVKVITSYSTELKELMRIGYSDVEGNTKSVFMYIITQLNLGIQFLLLFFFFFGGDGGAGVVIGST